MASNSGTAMVIQYSPLSKPSKARSRKLKVNSKVNDNEVIVDKKSNDLQVKIQKNYDNIALLFKAIGKNYRDCASKSVKGDKIVSSLKKVAKKCEDQGAACEARKKQLTTLYRADATKKNVEILENFLGSDIVGEIYFNQGDGQVHIV